ncbi:hypothetical protein SISSUDRAFT_1125466 [Sistotremastrum suecicum HHB10207 ss-3]|uniref:Homeobox domain-containing protein n=1 Tax=Sistotremastrum suecicum HHB10207 ss-3 TaxID=1314776 RepID=A0A166HDC5_9AGAM|nr:hypothetical protein SISSUDRAFT_1125466 [Sistotremastrum suecicum HHB10207 ss-3]
MKVINKRSTVTVTTRKQKTGPPDAKATIVAPKPETRQSTRIKKEEFPPGDPTKRGWSAFPKQIELLRRICEKEYRTPSLESRRKWSEKMKIPLDILNKWFYYRKGRFRDVWNESSWELPLTAPPPKEPSPPIVIKTEEIVDETALTMLPKRIHPTPPKPEPLARPPKLTSFTPSTSASTVLQSPISIRDHLPTMPMTRSDSSEHFTNPATCHICAHHRLSGSIQNDNSSVTMNPSSSDLPHAYHPPLYDPYKLSSIQANHNQGLYAGDLAWWNFNETEQHPSTDLRLPTQPRDNWHAPHIPETPPLHLGSTYYFDRQMHHPAQINGSSQPTQPPHRYNSHVAHRTDDFPNIMNPSVSLFPEIHGAYPRLV